MKRFLTTVACAMALTTTAFAADYQVAPAVGGDYNEIQKVTIRFDAPVELTGSNRPSITYNMDADGGATSNARGIKNGMNTIQADGNDLILTFTTVSGQNVLKAGEKFYATDGYPGSIEMANPSSIKLEIHGSFYTVGGEAGETLTLNYTVSNTGSRPVYTFEGETSFGFDVTPAEGWLQKSDQAKIFKLTFDGEVAFTEGNTNVATVKCYNDAGEVYFEGNGGSGFKSSCSGNVITIQTNAPVYLGNKTTFSYSSPELVEGTVVYNIAAGAYTVNGEPGPEINLTYVISDEDPNAPKIKIYPAPDSHVESLPEVVISFGKNDVPAWTSTSASIYWNGLTSKKYISLTSPAAAEGCKCGYEVRDNSLVITIPDGGLAPGWYEFSSVPSYTVNGETGEKLKFNIYVDEPNLDNAQELEYTATPNPIAIQKSLQYFELTFAEGSEVEYIMPFKEGINFSTESAEAAKTSWDNWFNGFTFGNSYAKGNKLYLAYTSVIPTTGKQHLWIYFAPGAIRVNGVYNKEFTLEYTVQAPDYFDYFAEPESGSTVLSLDDMSLEFSDVDPEEMTFEAVEGVKGQILRNGTLMENVYVAFNVYENYLQMGVVDSETNERIAVQDPGHYQVVIPEATFLIDGLGNAEITLNYDIAYAAAEFTANPEDGATIRGIDTIVLTFADVEEIGVTTTTGTINVSGAKRNVTFSAEGNQLTVELEWPYYATESSGNGEKTVTIPEGVYTIDGREGAAISINYTFDYTVEVYPATFDYTVSPEQGKIAALGNEPIVLDFYKAASRTWMVENQAIEGIKVLREGVEVENANMITVGYLMFDEGSYKLGVQFFNDDFEPVVLTELGNYEIVIPAGITTSYGVENKEFVLNYEVIDVTEMFDYTVEPEQGVVTYIPTPILTFANVKEANILKVAEETEGYINRNGEKMEGYYIFFESFFNESAESVDFNVIISANAEEPEQAYISEFGNYEVVIPAGTFTIYGKANEEITLSYNIIDREKLFEYNVTPAEGVVKTLGGSEEEDGIIVNFYNATSRADMDQNPMLEGVQLLLNGEAVENAEVFAGVGYGEENYELRVMVMNVEGEALSAPGKYEIVVPADAFLSYGAGNPEIKLSYEIIDEATLFNYELVNPESEVTYNISMITLAFPNAKSEDSFEIKDSSLCAISRNGTYVDGVYPMVETYFDEWTGSVNFNLAFSSNADEYEEAVISQPGEYVVFIPAGVFSIYGVENEEIILPFQIKYPFVEYTANPEDGAAVESISSIVLTFTEGEFEVFAADSADYVEVDGEVTRASYAAENNTLTVTLAEAIESVKGEAAKEMVITIPADKYMVRTSAMASEGEPLYGPAIVLTYTLDYTVGISGIAADGVKVIVYDAQGRVILKDADAKELDQLKGLYIVNGQKQIRK